VPVSTKISKQSLLNRNERLLDGYEDGIYSKEKYQES